MAKNTLSFSHVKYGVVNKFNRFVSDVNDVNYLTFSGVRMRHEENPAGDPGLYGKNDGLF